MRVRRRKRLTLTAAILAAAAALPARSAVNLALGKPYQWSVPPRYAQCMDAGDTTQLTDGVSADANWTVPSTVGWVHQGRVSVTIDLGEVHPLGRVAFTAAGGGHADVFFPAVTAVLASTDADAWYLRAAVGSGALVQDRSRWYAHRFETAPLSCRARYVRLVFQAEERYLFIDEIEVEAGPGAAKLPDGEAVAANSLEAVLQQGLRARWVTGEWRRFREQIARLAAQTAPDTAAAVAARLEAFDERANRLNVAERDTVETLRTDYTQWRNRLAQAVFKPGLHIRRVYPWAEYRGETLPPLQPDLALPAPAEVLAWQDEYETLAWTVTNLGPASARVRVRLEPLQAGRGGTRSWSGRRQWRQALLNPTRVGTRVADALPLLAAPDADTAEFEVPAGEYRLVWLTLRIRELAAARYTTAVRIEAVPDGRELLRSALTLTVPALQMPPADDRALAAYAWDEYLAKFEDPAAAVADLRAHGVNTFMMHPSELPRPRFDPERTRLISVDFTPMDAALALRQRPRLHGIFWGGPFSSWGLDLQDPGHAELFKEFVRAWAAHLEEKGYRPDQFFFYPLDEETSERMIRVATLIKQAEPQLQVYWNRVNPPDVDPEQMRRLAPYVDIASPVVFTLADYSDTRRQDATFAALREQYPFRVWTYACSGPGRLKAPDTYYRNLAWETFRRGGTGTGFWCYADGGAWDAYDGGLHYGVVYQAKNAPPEVTRVEPIIPSRRWEAFREGAEDFEVLAQLQRALTAAREAGLTVAAVAAAQTQLADTVQRVLDNPEDPARYRHARRTLTEHILKLRAAAAAGVGN